MVAEEKFAGIGRRERQRMRRQWKVEGRGKSLKAWARERLALVGDAAPLWLEAKRSS